jgi:hypothetical protein
MATSRRTVTVVCRVRVCSWCGREGRSELFEFSFRCAVRCRVGARGDDDVCGARSKVARIKANVNSDLFLVYRLSAVVTVRLIRRLYRTLL